MENEEIKKARKDIDDIQKRNLKVEMDKAWETSILRRVLISVLTYVVASLFFIFAKIKNPFLNAIVPTLGFILSTLSISFFKKMWMKNKEKVCDKK